jgi:RimJ/RimL family protein N-acetyltransferase
MMRAWQLEHAPLLLEAIAASRPELQRWTPWVIPQPFEEAVLVERLSTFRAQFQAGSTFIYGLFDQSDGRVLGQAGLYDRVGAGALEIGYWIRSDVTGRGYARAATQALLEVAFETLQMQRVEVRCDPNNAPSAAIPRRLGFTLREVLKLDPANDAHGAHELQVWDLHAGEYTGLQTLLG